MNTNTLKTPLLAVMAWLVLMLPCSAFAQNFGQHKIVDGVAVYLGVIPSEMIMGHPTSQTEMQMHGGAVADPSLYHVTFAFFDAATGKRISKVQAKASVSVLGQLGTEKKLEPMHIENTISYGNYFKMPGIETYRIRLQLRRPGVAQAIEADFDYHQVHR